MLQDAFNKQGKVDIQNYDKALESAYRRLAEAEILEKNRSSIEEFARLLGSMGLNRGRIAKYIFH
ncbi:MAG: hypothetical protein ACP5FU_06355, partial [Nitrososphaeria archaeon]